MTFVTYIPELLRLFRQHQRATNFVEYVYQLPLTLLENYVLIELSTAPDTTIEQLAQTICVDEPSVARAIRRLRRDHLLKESTVQHDKRRRSNQVTPRALDHLRSGVEASKRFLEPRLAALSIEEISELQCFFDHLCDSVSGPPVSLRSDDHPFDRGLRRVTRSLGFVGSSLFGSNYSSTVWQILSELKYSNSPVTPGSLQIELKIPPSTLSQICMRYEKEGWLSRIQDTGDRRQKVLAITPVGQLALSTIEEAGASILLRAFGDDAGKAGPRFCTLLEKYLHGELIRNEGVIRPQISMTEIAGDEERRAARGFFVFHLARLGRYLRVPESLIAASSTAFVVKSAQQVIAVIQVRDANLDKSSGEGLVVDLVHSETASDPTLIGDLLIALTRRVFRDGHADQTLVVSRDDLPSGTQEYLASKNALGIMLIVP